MDVELVRMDRADIYKSGVLAAQLLRHERTVEFRYDDGYLASRGEAVATTLPLTGEPFVTPSRSVPAYFAGLLPEGRRLTALRSALKTSADDDYSMLLAVGADPIGDVQVVPAGEPCPSVGDPNNGVELGDVSFIELFAAAVGADPDRVGIAGVQDKVSGRMISVPVTLSDGAGHLLKFDPPEFPHLVQNEAFFLGMASACGIETVESTVITDREGRFGLLITRFDRRRSSGRVVALACEDGCQVNNRYPADKYALDAEAMLSGLVRPCTARLVAARDLMRQMAFAIVTGNGDLHAKNISVLRDGDEWLPSPAYDLPSSAPYGDRTLAVAIGASREGQVSRRRFLALSESLGVPGRATTMMLDELLARAEPWLDRVTELPFDQRRCRDLAQLMRRRISLLRGD